MALEFRDYKKVAEGNLEHIRGDIWDVEFISWPLSVYSPGKDILKTRLIGFDGVPDSEPVLIDKTLLGHNVVSPGGRNSSPGDCTFNFNDREDQAISFMIHDYCNQVADSDTGFGRHKSELMFEFKVVFYNTRLEPVREIVYYDCIYTGKNLPDQVGEHGSDNSAVSLVVHCQHHKRFFL